MTARAYRRLYSFLRCRGIHVFPSLGQFPGHSFQSLGPYVSIRRVGVRFSVIGAIPIRFSRPLFHRKNVRRRVHLRLIIQPSRHIPNRHVVEYRVAIAGFVDNGIRARRESDFRGASFAEEFRVDVHAFAVDLVNVLCRIGEVAGVKVPADAELVAWFELDVLAFECVADGFRDVSLQAGHVAILHPGGSRFPKDQFKTEPSTYESFTTYDLGNVVVTSMRLFADNTTSGPPIAWRAAMRG